MTPRSHRILGIALILGATIAGSVTLAVYKSCFERAALHAMASDVAIVEDPEGTFTVTRWTGAGDLHVLVAWYRERRFSPPFGTGQGFLLSHRAGLSLEAWPESETRTPRSIDSEQLAAALLAHAGQPRSKHIAATRFMRADELHPTRLFWGNIAIVASIGLAIVACMTRVFAIGWKHLKLSNTARNECKGCGYSRSGLGASAPCPECGSTP